MSDIKIRTNYPESLQAFGLPKRLSGVKSFSAKSCIKPFQVNTLMWNVKKQTNALEEAMYGEPGWLLYICSNNLLDYSKHLAANIMATYFSNGLRPEWIASLDKADKLHYSTFSLVVIDAIFKDSSSYRRDKIYEIVNHHCNVKDLSICIIGQYEDPVEMSTHLGMKPNFGILTK
jgi:hypothetical protein